MFNAGIPGPAFFGRRVPGVRRFLFGVPIAFCLFGTAPIDPVYAGSDKPVSKNQIASDAKSRAVEAFEKGEFQRGFRVLEPLAESGDPEAQAWVGLVLARSHLQGALTKTGASKGIFAEKNFSGLPEDPAKGVAFLQQSANADCPHALYFLAYLHLLGSGVDKDEKRSLELMHRAADLGSLAAQIQMALHLMSTAPAESYKWFFIFAHCGPLGKKHDKSHWETWRLVWSANDRNRDEFVAKGEKLIAAWRHKHGKLCQNQ